ncbi:Holliday junction resolvase RuvX [Candidatus Saccharibacteria bacterium]|nr:Holliday junction resolvase RuvX [Candidatus Saccharibacteria bacterium]
MNIVALDIGEKRVGIAKASGKIAIPLATVSPDDLLATLEEAAPDLIVVGLPRNSSGEETKQTATVRAVASGLPYEVVFQDESLTSVLARENLDTTGRPYDKMDIDKEAARIILQDWLERNHHA